MTLKKLPADLKHKITMPLLYNAVIATDLELAR